MASMLIAYGGLLAGLGFLLQQAAPALGKVTFVTSSAGGGLCLLWGIAALAGLKGRAWAVLTTIAATIVLLSQAVHVWMRSAGETPTSLTVRLLVTVMMLLTIGLLVYLLHGERPPEFYDPKASRQDNPMSHREHPQLPMADRRP